MLYALGRLPEYRVAGTMIGLPTQLLVPLHRRYRRPAVSPAACSAPVRSSTGRTVPTSRPSVSPATSPVVPHRRQPALPAHATDTCPSPGVRSECPALVLPRALADLGRRPGLLRPAAPAERPGAEIFFRAWRLAWDQFEDLLAQEMVAPPPRSTSCRARWSKAFPCWPGPGRYDRLICVGTLEGLPVLTFTAPGPPESLTPAVPSLAYLAHIVTGLREAFDLDPPAIVDYLGRASRSDFRPRSCGSAHEAGLRGDSSEGERHVT